jgi:predicted metalloendopeptidase
MLTCGNATQPPFFALGRPMSLNFGGIGAIMGHEMTHGFDLNGRMLDAHGLANDWWSESAAAQFKERAKCVDTVMNTVGAPRLYAQV